MNMDKYLTQEAIVLKLKKLAISNTWKIVEYPSMVLINYVDHLNRVIKVQLNKGDTLHHVRINGDRELMSESYLVSALS